MHACALGGSANDWCMEYMGECKSWTLDSGLDHGLDYGLEYGLNSRLIFKLLAMVASHDLH